MNNLNKKKKIKLLKDNYREHVWNVITEIGVEERHINNLESEYRKLESTWLLAYFAAIGFTLRE